MTDELEFYKTEYERLEKHFNEIYKYSLKIYEKKFNTKLKHDGSKISKIMFMLKEFKNLNL
jgi:hypothetical protein